MIIRNRTSCRPIRSVIILVIEQIGRPRILLITRMITDRARPNWTPRSPVTITKRSLFFRGFRSVTIGRNIVLLIHNGL